MEGVKILAENKTLTMDSGGLILFFVVLGVVMMFIMFIDMIKSKSITSLNIIAKITIPCLMLASIATLCYFAFDFQNRYDVIIDKNVNYIEFMNKYEVIKQKGQIYTVIEKEN